MKLNLPTVAALAFAAYAVNAYSQASKASKAGAEARAADPAKAQTKDALQTWVDQINGQYAMFGQSMQDSQGHVTSATPFGFFTL